MATSDERRKVAYRLRTNFVSFAKDRGESGATYPLRCICALGHLIGAKFSDWLTINDRLADLIDPTCELRFDAVHQDFVCGACSHRFDSFQTFDGHGKWHDMRYCPNCGARVVSGDE